MPLHFICSFIWKPYIYFIYSNTEPIPFISSGIPISRYHASSELLSFITLSIIHCFFMDIKTQSKFIYSIFLKKNLINFEPLLILLHCVYLVLHLILILFLCHLRIQLLFYSQEVFDLNIYLGYYLPFLFHLYLKHYNYPL